MMLGGGATHARDRISHALLLVAAVALLLASVWTASARAQGEAKDTVTFACGSVTYSFSGFPDANGNTVTEVVTVDGEQVATAMFTFNGPSGSNIVPVTVPAGHHSIDARARWNTNGAIGGKDTPRKDGITCTPPTVTSVTPASGPTEGGTAVTIEGSGFVTGAIVTIGGEASEVNVVSEQEITATTTAHAGGSDEVKVSDINGRSTGGPSFTYVPPPPAVTSVTPATGTTEGGTAVTIKGSGFVAPALVTIGGEASQVHVISEQEITATTSEQAAGSDEVIVTNINGKSVGGPTYTYVIPPPKVTSITPKSGTTEGGAAVTIRGSGFVAPIEVTIGGEVGEVNLISEHELTTTTTKHAAGPAEVVVKDIRGKSSAGPTYTYVIPPPQVTSITPLSGSTEGGSPVTIKGSGFVAPALVRIGGEASAVHVISEHEITAATTKHRAGPVEVIVEDIRGKSTGGPGFTYVAPRTLLELGGGGPITGPPAGSGVLSSITSVLVPPPVLGVSGNISPLSGVVLVKLPGSRAFVALTGLSQVPFGTIVDATNGRVSVTTAGPHGGTQTIVFYGGRFTLLQGHNGLVVAVLSGGNFSVCPTAKERSHLARASSKRASPKHVVRKLWSNGHGSFSTKGNYAAGAVLGTIWLTEDLCDGTLIHVSTDRVAVTNLVNHHHVTVKAGHSYLAKAP
jgi:hypothetical protein